MELDAQFEPNGGGGGGGAVDSVNGKTGTVVLDAGDLGYDGSETYDSGTVGKAISDLNGDLNGKLDAPSTAGTSGQVLTSDGQGGQSWQTPQSGGSVSPYTSNPAALGTASPGSSDNYARGDHVHAMPTASDIGAEASTNKVTSLSSLSTDTQYPSAKCVYDLIGDVETLLSAI